MVGDYENRLTIHRAVILWIRDKLNCSELVAERAFIKYRHAVLVPPNYCVRWEQADRNFPIPVRFLAVYGDTEQAALEFIKEGFSGEAKEQAVPWLTANGREDMAKQLGVKLPEEKPPKRDTSFWSKMP
tara:strand:+ start:697 stop:1083 length:387 start_codon:yes stop_codon:yes gene_type:complete